MSNNDTPQHSLVDRLEEALLLSGMSTTKFCYVHFGDPAFMARMRKGRQPRGAMIEKIETLLKEMGV